MTIQNFVLTILTGFLLVFAFYYLFAVLLIHKKIFDKYFYFVIASFSSASYVFFQLLLSLEFNDYQYLLFHKLKMISTMFFFSFWLYTLYECYFLKGRKIIPLIFLMITPLFLILVPYDFFTSLPVKTLEINTPISLFIQHVGTTNLGYSVYALVYLSVCLLSILYYFISRTDGKNPIFPFALIGGTIVSIHDFAISHRFINNILIGEYWIFILVVIVFLDFLREDRKTYLRVIELNKEAIRRLRITEIYTRKSLVESIEKGEDPTKFQPNNIQIATLFTDIRDFTGISEGLQPLEVVELLNSYFNRMNSTIIKHKGEIDKLMGDCIMALFHNPDDALKSAIEIRMELDRFNAVINCHSERSEESSINEVSGFFTPLRSVQNDKILRPLDNGIGLNYGEVIIGNIGSESKMDYTVVGDIVNTASRLEALTKYYKVPLIISEDLKVKLKDDYNIRFLDEALVKGKSTPVKIYEVYDFESDENKKTRERNEKPLREAFALYQQGEFLKAIEIYESCCQLSESSKLSESYQPDPVLPFFIERCKNLQLRKEAGLLKEWNGVFEFMDK